MIRNQKGFSAVEALLIVIIVGMLGGVGYYVWHSQKQVDNTYSQTANSSAAPKLKEKIITIPEWGVKATIATNLTLQYKIEEGNSSFAKFSSKELKSSGPYCGDGTGNYGGGIERYLQNEEVHTGSDGAGTGLSAADYAKTLKANEYGHVGAYYYFYSGIGEPCGDKPTMQSKTFYLCLNLFRPSNFLLQLGDGSH
jgi:hypothetical protein